MTKHLQCSWSFREPTGMTKQNKSYNLDLTVLQHASLKQCLTCEKHHSRQSVQRGEAASFVAPGFGVRGSVRRGRGNRDIKCRVGNMQSLSFAFLWASFGVTWMRSIAMGAGRMVSPAAFRELWCGVRVQRWAGFWAGMSILRFPLRTRGGQERRERSRF